MRYLLTSLLCVLTLSLTAQEAGCTYQEAGNYSSTATVDDGTCVFECITCGEGTVLHENTQTCIISESFCSWQPDSNSDGNVGASDLLAFLSVFGDSDSDGDGVYDTIDDCIDLAACNYQSNPTEACVYIDALGICGGDCLVDADGDGVCDCGESVTHEGYDYSTVQIGDHCWFAENCRYLPEVSDSSIDSTTEPHYYVYGYEGTDVAAAQATENYATYGALYNWSAVMTEGICPSGWHIPSDGEWQTMEMSLGMSEAVAAQTGWRGAPVGDYLKSTSGWNSGDNGSNSSGFTGLPGGSRFSGGFLDNGGHGLWWSASESDSNSWRRVLYTDYDSVDRSSDSRDNGFSARCVRD
tara:strand:- start:364 stop:1425 length:1062 start_codon:yes stop_codon:yes gene_type:complete